MEPRLSLWETNLERRGIAPIKAPAAFSSLGNYDYRLFFLGQVVSQSGSWVQRVAQAWLVLEITESPVALGTVTALQFLPILFLSLFAGTVADRFPKKHLLGLIQAVLALEGLTLAGLVMAGWIELWQVYLLALLHGIATAMEQPVRHVFPFELVGRDLLTNAVALNSVNFNTARILGPALGGVIVVWLDLEGAFLVNALGHLGVVASLAMMRKPARPAQPAGEGETLVKQLSEALTYVARSPTLVTTFGLVTCMSIFGHNYSTFLPLLARYELNLGASGFGFLTSAVGCGALVGALAVAQRGGSSEGILVGAGLAFAGMLVGIGLSPWFEVSLVLLVVLGCAGTIFSTSANTIIQLAAPEAMRGRIMGLYSLLFAGMTPFGATITGGLAALWGTRVALELEAGACVVGLVAAAIYQRSRARQ